MTQRKEPNTDIKQSYKWTIAKRRFSLYEERCLRYIVRVLQKHTSGLEAGDKVVVQNNLFNDYKTISFPIQNILKGENDKNYSKVKSALKKLHRSYFEYEDDKIWAEYQLITKPKIDKRSGLAVFDVDMEFFNILLDFTKGYRNYEFDLIMGFKSVYAMRFYELITGQIGTLFNHPISIEWLRKMFGLEKKYEYIKDFRIDLYIFSN